MKKGLGGLGILALVVAMAIVLFLAAKGWSRAAPTAIEVRRPVPADEPQAAERLDGLVDSGALPSSPASSNLPGLSDMQRGTGAHADALQEALDATH